MHPILKLKDEVLYHGRIGLLCNQTAFDPDLRLYLFEALTGRRVLKRLFVPEHGLFAELQDQIPLSDSAAYTGLGLGVEVVSLYGRTADSRKISQRHLEDLDAIVIDVQDVGCRYFTFTITVSYLFAALSAADLGTVVYVVDRPNPAGRQVEGIPLQQEYASFLGRAGLPHRHGLTLGELCRLFQDEAGGRFEVRIVPFVERSSSISAGVPRSTWEIPPSPNMPGPLTPLVYSGQCLLEGTNLSEGRGTTRPFEIFGAPYMDWIYRQKAQPAVEGAVLRPLRFVPTTHLHAGEICHGYQIHLTSDPYHSLAHSLQLIRFIKENSGRDFHWLEGAYEQGSTRSAIELLAGDDILLDYLAGRVSFKVVRSALEAGEVDWIRRASAYLISPEPLQRVPYIRDMVLS